MIGIALRDLMAIVRLVAVVNTVLVFGLVVVWFRSYRQFRARHTQGLLVFGGLLFIQNVLAIYLYTFDPNFTRWMMRAEPPAMLGMISLMMLQLAAFLFLTRITWT